MHSSVLSLARPDFLLRSLPAAGLIALILLLFSRPVRAAYTDADADRLYDAFNTAFYQSQSNNRGYYREDLSGGRAWFWGQANMVEMVADAYDRVPSQDRRDRLAALCRGFTDYHGTSWTWNEYNDDIIWACIVFAKAYRATDDSAFLTRSTSNFNAVWNRAWATNLGGGLYWKNSSGGRNACVNAPAAIAACLLYDITGDIAYLDKARAIIAWMDANLVVQSSGAIDDHILTNGSRVGWRFTYNQGTYVGACSALYRITGQLSYLQNAVKAARYTRDSMCNAVGIFPDHGTSGDGGGFNGIGIRWITRMVRDQGLWDEFYPWLKANADAAWNIRRRADDLSWANWRAATPAPPQGLTAFGCYGSVVALQVVPSADPSDISGIPGPLPAAIHQAESAQLQDGVAVANNVSGFRGTGFADYVSGLGEAITFTVNAASAGPQWVSFRYGNGGTANRPVRLRVNGILIQDLPFAPTGSWSTWHYTPGILATLNEGANTIQLAPTQAAAPNVDLLYLSAAPAPPPPGATVLFDGTTSSLDARWHRAANGAAANWTVSAGAMAVVPSPAGNDIATREGYRDFKLHLEWLAPPGGLGAEAADSGVKLQGLYEIQILNTPRGQTPGPFAAGAIRKQRAPATNASLGAGHWQSYDIDFTAARWNGTTKVADARVTVYWNGVLVHDDVALTSPTEGSPAESPGPHPILLQASATGASGPVRFRNVWVVPKTSHVLEAEDAMLTGPAVVTGNAGYTGRGFADYGSAIGETVTWTVDAQEAGPHWVSFRYANGTAAGRPLDLVVNGTTIRRLPFGGSGGWTNWIFTDGLAVPLNAGANIIRLVSTIANGPNVDHLYVSTPGRTAPAGAVVLFDGTASSLASHWMRDGDGGAPDWTVAERALGVVAAPAGNDLATRLGFRDFELHLEWLSPPAGKSGVKLQRGYEIQILGTPPGQTPSADAAGAILGQRAPDIDPGSVSGHWQSYDIRFTAARWSGNVKTADARVRVYWNDVLVHDDVALPQTTDGSPEAPGFHPLSLEGVAADTSGPVRFRNIWVTGESQLPDPATPQEFWSEWLDLAGLTGADRDSSADPDGDGLANLWEYLTGGNPREPDLIAPSGEFSAPRVAFVGSGGHRFAEFTFLRRADHAGRGLTVAAESSTDPGIAPWAPQAAILSGPPQPIGDGTFERVTIRVDLPLGSEPRMFFRLRAHLAED